MDRQTSSNYTVLRIYETRIDLRSKISTCRQQYHKERCKQRSKERTDNP